jgi:acetyltransferase-like isoleucine patch superfamily enzyme
LAHGGHIKIGDNVYIGDGVIIVSIDHISIAKDTLVAEYVVIRDQDHSLDSRPIQSGSFLATPIFIGEDCWLGAKSTVLRGSTIGNGAVIGAHSLVRGAIPAFTLAVGCPAIVVKSRSQE